MEYKLNAVKREVKGEKIRKEGLIPAILYGVEKDSLSLSLVYNDFVKLYQQAGNSSLINMIVDDKDNGQVLVQDIQYDPVTDRPIHVDLRRIDMSKEIITMVGLEFVNNAPIVKEAGGTLIKNIREVEVKCLPKDLVSNIEVDLAVITTFDINIKIKDLQIPTGITITSPGKEDVIAKAVPALTEEQLKAMDEAEAADVESVEVSGEKKDEEEGDEAGGEEKKEEGKEEKKEEEKK